MTRWTLCVLLVAILCVPVRAEAKDAKLPEIVGVRVGFAGRYKVGVWTPVEVRWRGGGRRSSGEVSLIVPDGDGVPSRVSRPVAEDETSVMLYARFGRVESELTVQFRAEDGTAVGKVFQTAASRDDTHFLPAVAATRKMILSVGADPIGVEEAVELLHEEADERTVVVRLKDFRQLPTQWYGYEGVDKLVISTSHAEIVSNLHPTSPQIVALDEWIQMGGMLVLCVGGQAEKVLAEGSPLAAFAPGKLQEMTTLRQTRALETFAMSSTAVPQPDDGDAQLELHVPHLIDTEGVTEAIEANLPLVVRTPRGFGQIVFVAADLDRRPLGTWKDRRLLVARLLDFQTDRIGETQDKSAVMHYSFNDMTGQLRSALDQFSRVWLMPFWAAVVLIVGYILLIGPVDYFFLRKVVRRMTWTWVTFPAIVLGVCVAAYALAYYLKGDQLRINQLDLVDVDLASQRVRGTSWANLFSPRMELYDLSIRPRLPDGNLPRDASVLFSWMGLPGQGLGGMNPRTSNPVSWNDAYEFSAALDAMHRIPIPVWSTKSFTVRWNARAEVGLQAELTERQQVPTGKITNSLGFPLSNCLLAYGRHVYKLDRLESGESIQVDARLRRSQLKTLLTRRRDVADGSGSDPYQKATPYDQSSVEVPYIMQATMFYEAAGGRRYTGLHNGYQSFVDLSSLLKTNRAILLAQAPAGHRAAELLRDGRRMTEQEDQHITIYRFILPVKAEGSRQ